MLPLDSPIWSELSHHFGTGETIPPALQELYNCLADQQLDEDRYRVAVCGLDDQLENIFHQACICPAAGPALPHILALIPGSNWRIRFQSISLVVGYTTRALARSMTTNR